MSVTLERCYSVNKYIYVNAVDCTDTYDECRDSATGDYGVYCDGTFYSRCYNGTDYSCVVGDGCCEECTCNSEPNCTCCFCVELEYQHYYAGAWHQHGALKYGCVEWVESCCWIGSFEYYSTRPMILQYVAIGDYWSAKWKLSGSFTCEESPEAELDMEQTQAFGTFCQDGGTLIGLSSPPGDAYRMKFIFTPCVTDCVGCPS